MAQGMGGYVTLRWALNSTPGILLVTLGAVLEHAYMPFGLLTRRVADGSVDLLVRSPVKVERAEGGCWEGCVFFEVFRCGVSRAWCTGGVVPCVCKSTLGTPKLNNVFRSTRSTKRNETWLPPLRTSFRIDG